MEFRKTTVLPLGNPAEAQRLLRRWIFDEPHIVFVALGEGAVAEALVARAGRLAGPDEEKRWVVWARSEKDIDDVIVQLNVDDAKKGAIRNGALAFSVSFGNEIADVVDRNDELDNVRVEIAYARAEAKG